MDAQELKTGLDELGQEIVALPRHPTIGYKGKIKHKRLIVVEVVECEDGQDRVIDPAELTDDRPDVAVRDWITVRGNDAGGREHVKPGGSGGLDVGNLLSVLGAGGGPTAGGWLGLLRGIIGK